MSTYTRPPLRSVRQWDGRWIWCKGEAKPYHFYLYARKTFILDGEPTSAQLHITASDRYVLYLNGRYLGRGPARSDPRRKSYDTYDVAASLQKGTNVIGMRAYHYGMPARGEPRAVTQYFYEAPLLGEGWGAGREAATRLASEPAYGFSSTSPRRQARRPWSQAMRRGALARHRRGIDPCD